MANELKQLIDILTGVREFSGTVESVDGSSVVVRGPGGSHRVSSSMAVSAGDRVTVSGGSVTGKIRKGSVPKTYYL